MIIFAPTISSSAIQRHLWNAHQDSDAYHSTSQCLSWKWKDSRVQSNRFDDMAGTLELHASSDRPWPSYPAFAPLRPAEVICVEWGNTSRVIDFVARLEDRCVCDKDEDNWKNNISHCGFLIAATRLRYLIFSRFWNRPTKSRVLYRNKNWNAFYM